MNASSDESQLAKEMMTSKRETSQPQNSYERPSARRDDDESCRGDAQHEQAHALSKMTSIARGELIHSERCVLRNLSDNETVASSPEGGIQPFVSKTK